MANVVETQKINGAISSKQSVSGSMKPIPALDETLSKKNCAAEASAVGAALAGKAPISHVTDYNNPHKTTAEQVGARPNDWMPTAEEVGARPNTWLPTIAEIGAAPSGYGLGDGVYTPVLVKITEVDNFRENGWRIVSLNSIETPIGNTRTGLLHCCAGDRFVKQTFYSYSTGYGGAYKLERMWWYGDDTWHEWEWVNPPMQVGIEYRTTERRNGKPVYIKCISYTTSGLIGGFEAGCVEVEIPHGCSNFGELVDCVGKIETQPLPTISRTGGLATVHVVDAVNITVRLYNTGLNGTFTFVLRYTKA